MQTPLAIYEALIQANAPVEAARHAAEMLERDMTTVLATRQDIQKVELSIRGDIRLLDARFDALEQRTDTKLDALHGELDSRLDSLGKEMDSRFALVDERFLSLEQRLVIKLGALMTVLMTLMVGAAGALAAFIVRA